ncbi:coiled-coil domain-containing protein 60-like protein [Camelus ferus]|nr:coiled-coil domain-containing protein 60-like protein [Camelus ferus]
MRSIRYMDKEIINLKKDLIRSRIFQGGIINGAFGKAAQGKSVKIGHGYFSMLREESALKKQQQQRRKLEEEERHKFQPAKKISEIHYGDILLTTYEDERTKKMGAGVILQPFIPVHSCIIAPLLPKAHVEPLFRQLCALHWLLEALTIDHTHHTMKPVITCWNPKTFPTCAFDLLGLVVQEPRPPPSWLLPKQEYHPIPLETKKSKIPVIRATSRKPSRRGSTLSLSRTSGGSSPQSSMVSGNPGSDEPQSVITQATGSKDVEDNESSSTKPDEEPLHANLQKLLEMVREDTRRTNTVENGMQKQAPSHANRDIVHGKSGVCNTMRAKFYSVAQEAGFCLQDKMEIFIKYFDLLSKLPEDLKTFRPARKILAKLQKFGENLDLRIRPHVLLKVLQDLRIWELCSPDIAVAIEFVREHVVHMPQEDYINWLQNRINVPIRPHSAQP